MTSQTYVIGDAHGQYEKLARLLRDGDLAGPDLHWTGGPACLWLMGDFFDRGPDGAGVVDLVRRLQQEASAAGGRVNAVLGNHDVMILAVRRFGQSQPGGGGWGTFYRDWLSNGGQPADLARLSAEQATWLAHLPAMACAGKYLLVHADAEFYLRYGRSVDEVNQTLHSLLENNAAWAWDQLLGLFAERKAFAGDNGPTAAREFLDVYGGEQIVHGHTPITKLNGEAAENISQAYTYAAGLCVDVDGGMYLGGPGFIHQLP